MRVLRLHHELRYSQFCSLRTKNSSSEKLSDKEIRKLIEERAS